MSWYIDNFVRRLVDEINGKFYITKFAPTGRCSYEEINLKEYCRIKCFDDRGIARSYEKVLEDIKEKVKGEEYYICIREEKNKNRTERFYKVLIKK